MFIFIEGMVVLLLIRNEKTVKEFCLLYPVTSIIILINIIIMIYTTLLGGLSNPEILYNLGGVKKEAILDGEVYRLVTYAFIHNGISHFSFNMIFTILLAPTIEKLLGKTRFIVMFFFTILATSLVIICLSKGPDVGESGFGYGLLGFYLFLMMFKKSIMDKHSKIALILFIIIGWILTIAIPKISFLGHFGGFIAGFIFAALVCNSLHSVYNQKDSQMY